MDIAAKKNVRWVSQPFSSPKIALDDITQDFPIFLEILPPINYFSRYFSDNDFENMALFTYMYAHQNASTWKKIMDKMEMKTFIALKIRLLI